MRAFVDSAVYEKNMIELQAIFGDVKKRPRLTMFDDFGGRVPSDKPPIKTPGELAIERGEPWPPPVPEPAFKLAIAEASKTAEAAAGRNGSNGVGGNGSPVNGKGGHANGAPGSTQPDYGAPAGWHAPGWPPPHGGGGQQPQGYWYPPPPPPPTGWQPPPPHPGAPPHPNVGAGAPPQQGQPYPPYQPYPQPGQHVPQGGAPAPAPHDEPKHGDRSDDRRNPPPPG